VSENDPGRESHLKHRIGMSRRDLLRRGAVVGGTLLWTIPVVKTLSSAHEKATGSPAFVCCECVEPKQPNQIGTKKCGTDFTSTECHADQVSLATESACLSYCQTKSKAYCWHTAPTPIGCSGNVCNAH
jgi:hypothetical protein